MQTEPATRIFGLRPFDHSGGKCAFAYQILLRTVELLHVQVEGTRLLSQAHFEFLRTPQVLDALLLTFG